MHDWVPERLELAADTEPARWVEERLEPWDPRPAAAVRVRSYMPDVFEAYARVLHPARHVADERPVSWHELARERGVEITSRTSFFDVSGISMDGPGEPEEGSLPRELLRALPAILEGHTSTPNRCWFCFWEGHGALWSRAHSTLVTPDVQDLLEPVEPPAWMLEDAEPTEQDLIWERAPKVAAPHRGYLLFSGPLTVVHELAEFERWAPGLNMWWPDDRAWFVSTEVDAITTYVGGTREAIDALLSSDTVEAVEAQVDDPLDPRGPRLGGQSD